jgi:hypothetical protein
MALRLLRVPCLGGRGEGGRLFAVRCAALNAPAKGQRVDSKMVLCLRNVRAVKGGVHAMRCLTNRWSGRVIDKVPSSDVGARAAQLNR